MVTPLRLGGRTVEFSAIHHFLSAPLLRCVARFMKEPAPLLVPPDCQSCPPCFSSLRRSWGRASLSAMVFAISSSGTHFLGIRGLPGFSGFSWIFVCEGYVARILHAELSSNVLMEPACHFMISLMGNFVRLLIQAHWGIPTHRTQSGIYICFCATARSHSVDCYGRRNPGSHTNPTSSPGQFVLLS